MGYSYFGLLMDRCKVILVDDHRVVIDGISSLLSGVDHIEIIGTATDETALTELLKVQPADVILLDVFLPKPIGIEILKDIRSTYPSTKVIMLSGNYEEDLIAGAFKAGANGYMTKSVDKMELVEAIEAVMSGNKYIGKSLEKNLTQAFLKRAVDGDKYAIHKLTGLSPREVEIITLLAEGLSHKEIAKQLEISSRTVESHKANLLEKLDLKNTIDLVKFAIKNRLIEL